MPTSKTLPFSAFKLLLEALGFRFVQSPKALIFHHPTEGLLPFRIYRDEESMAPRDLASTR